MKTIFPARALFLAALASSVVPSLDAITFEIRGVITSFGMTSQTLPNFGISAGDSFQGFLSYDETAVDQWPLDPSNGWYWLGASSRLTLTVRGQTFITRIASINVSNGTTDRVSFWGGIFPFETETSFIQTPWANRRPDGPDYFSGGFSDDTGTALSSDGLPVDFNLPDWTSNSISFTVNLGSEGSAILDAEITAIPQIAPVVRAMPDGIKTLTKNSAYTWVGNPLVVWGSVAWGTSNSGNFVWNFGDGSATVAGPITNAADIAQTHTYATAGTFIATLTVTDGNGATGSAQVRIDVLPVENTQENRLLVKQARINLAVERGLKRLYLDEARDGYRSATRAALAVLAFENLGHQPVSGATDIYRDTVIRGLNFLFNLLEYRTSFPNWRNPDANGNGVVLGLPAEFVDPFFGSFPTQGAMMKALAAAGSYDKNYPKTDPLHNPALNLTVPSSIAHIGGMRYYDVLQDMMEYVAWDQADPGTFGQGGWSVSSNSGEADNVHGIWPVLGLEAAESWGIVAPDWVKSELRDNWLQKSYNNSLGGWGVHGPANCTLTTSGAGLSMMSYSGIAKSDPQAIAAWNAVAANWHGHWNGRWELLTYEGLDWGYFPAHFGEVWVWKGNYPWVMEDVFNAYAMYGIAMAARNARDEFDNVSPITAIGGIDWSAEYVDYLLPKQQSDGSWPGWWIWDTTFSTPFAILILEPSLATSLRPQPAISASPNPVPVGTTVNFDIRGSTHEDPVKYLVSWKVIFDTNSGKTWSNPDAWGMFPVGGTIPMAGGYPGKTPPAGYDVTAAVQVTDNVGGIAEAFTTVHIVLLPPVANLPYPLLARLNQQYPIHGSGSYDPNPGGSIVRYEWDLDGNGSFETDTGTSSTISREWTTPYSGQIGLRVTGSAGPTSTATAYQWINACDLVPYKYILTSSRRVSASIWEYSYHFEIRNVGGAANSPVYIYAELQEWPAQVSVVDRSVEFGDGYHPLKCCGEPTRSTDTFTIRIDRRFPVHNQDLGWKITVTDRANTWILMHFPLALSP